MKKRRGFVQLAILHLLRDDSMHGYQIMKELEERSDGHYLASAGTVYPALQELQNKEMIDLESESDKKVYFIDKKGKDRLEEFAKSGKGDFWMEWKEWSIWRNSTESVQLKEAIDLWEVEMRKAMKGARMNAEKSVELIAFLKEITERLKKENR